VYLLSNPSVFSLGETFTLQILDSELMTTNILGTTHLDGCQTWSSDVNQQQGCVSKQTSSPPSHTPAIMCFWTRSTIWMPSFMCMVNLAWPIIMNQCVHISSFLVTYLNTSSQHTYAKWHSNVQQLYLKPTAKDDLKMDPSTALSIGNLLVTRYPQHKLKNTTSAWPFYV
jgi:hypothetical protein